MGSGPLGLGVLGGGDDKGKEGKVDDLGHDLGAALHNAEKALGEALGALMEIESIAGLDAVDINLQKQRIANAGREIDNLRSSLEAFNGFLEMTKQRLRLRGKPRG